MQDTIILRHKALQSTRKFLSEADFLEIETPILMKSTPEGARDYLVPSRVHPNKFYALPQSPQTYKQLLMVSGFDRYFQIARCFRDEDLRSDRQPEFTQIDIEMSFIHNTDIMDVAERLLVQIMKDTISRSLPLPLPKMEYKEAMRRFGSDKPDTRFGMEIVDLSDLMKNCGFKVFDNAVDSGGIVIAITTEGAPNYSRKNLGDIEAKAKEFGASGLASMKYDGEKLSGSIAKFFSDEILNEICKRCNPKENDSIFFFADKADVAYTLAGNMRSYLGKELNLYRPDDFKALWITNYPMFEKTDDGNQHPCITRSQNHSPKIFR